MIPKLETYTASEAELVTKVPQATVRNWRRAGYLTRQEGHARYTIADLFLLTAMQSLVSRGITPETAHTFAPEIARALFVSALGKPDAYSAALIDDAKTQIGEVSPAPVDEVSFSADQPLTASAIQYWDALRLAMDATEKKFGLTGQRAANWFIIWANSETEFYFEEDTSEQTFFGNTRYDEYTMGPVIMFCLGAIATMVIDKLPRPAFTLSEGK